MAFIGTPLDTRNTFQSLAGKRFDGDGSTTAFTLDVAPSSTLDIEVFVGNVRQDPNSAYTLSGTTLTFTGAPPSGTNNIYVVHQAKSVGTIDPPATETIAKTFSSTVQLGGTADMNGTEFILDADADTSITADTDDQIDIRIAGADDFQFTANTFTAQSGSTITTPTLGVINAHDLGAGIHIKTADSGASVSSEADELVIEHGNAIGGMSFLAATDGVSKIAFGDSGDNDIGMISYTHDGNRMMFNVNAAERLRIASDGEVSINDAHTDIGSTTAFKIKGGSGAPCSIITHKGTSGDNAIFHFKDGGNELCGSVTINAGNHTTAYNTSSDYRLKENVDYSWDATTRLKQLKPARFNWKSNSSGDKVDGFLAHEVSSVVPEAIYGEKDAMIPEVLYTANDELPEGKNIGDVKEATKINAQGIDQSKLVPLLVKTIQELEARITTLEG